VKITDFPSPNFGPRRHGLPPDMVVLHHTAMLWAKAAITRLCDPLAEVSAHYVVSETGEITRLVPEDMRAWHAGAGCWGRVFDVNSHSIGIELANSGPLGGFPPFPEPQIAALEGLLRGVFARWDILPERVIAHSDMAPTRKFDPGAKFDWRRLALGGLSVWPDEGACATPDWAGFRGACGRLGYDTEAGDAPLLSAFRLRFHPFAGGPLDPVDMGRALDLAHRFPVDLSIESA